LIKNSEFLKISHITKIFGTVKAVDDVELIIPKGQIFGLLGSSGCGKSTLLRMLAGFETQTSGSIFLNGLDITNVQPYERPINMMFQSYALFPHLTVYENIAFGLKRLGQDSVTIKNRVDEMLSLVKLNNFANRKPNQLSGGQQQRVALARSLAREPLLLLLDEPLGALDKKLRQETQFELMSIIHGVGVTCVMVTHDQEEAMTMSDQVAVMSEGKILQVGSPREIYEIPSNKFVADFIGNINFINGRLTSFDNSDSIISTNIGTFKVTSSKIFSHNANVSIAIRPEKIHISKDVPSISENIFKGKISEIGYMGSYILFDIVADSNTTIRVMQVNASRQIESAFVIGDEVYCTFPKISGILLDR